MFVLLLDLFQDDLRFLFSPHQVNHDVDFYSQISQSAFYTLSHIRIPSTFAHSMITIFFGTPRNLAF